MEPLAAVAGETRLAVVGIDTGSGEKLVWSGMEILVRSRPREMQPFVRGKRHELLEPWRWAQDLYLAIFSMRYRLPWPSSSKLASSPTFLPVSACASRV